MRLPSAGSDGQSHFAIAWFTITTGSEFSWSPELKSRPETSPVPTDCIRPSLTTVYSAMGTPPSSVLTGTPSGTNTEASWAPLSGSGLPSPAAWTPGIALSRLSRSANIGTAAGCSL